MREVLMSAIRQRAVKRLAGQGAPTVLSEGKRAIQEGRWTNYWAEGIKRDPDLGEAKLQEYLAKAKGNALVTKVMREGILSDLAQTLGVIHDVVIQAATKMAVARDIIWVVPTVETKTRFFSRTRSKCWRMQDGPSLTTGGRHTPIDISLSKEWGQDALFSKSYIEDTPYPVIEQEIAEMGQLLEEQMTTDVVTIYDAVAEANLAGGANVDVAASGTLAWADIVSAWTTLKTAGGRADVLLIHPNEVADLWNDDKFIHQFYFGELVDVARGVLGTSYLGFKIVESDLMVDASDYGYLIDLDRASALTLRRDITTEPYNEKLMEGVISTMRYGLGTLTPATGLARIDVTP